MVAVTGVTDKMGKVESDYMLIFYPAAPVSNCARSDALGAFRLLSVTCYLCLFPFYFQYVRGNRLSVTAKKTMPVKCARRKRVGIPTLASLLRFWLPWGH